MHNVCLSVALHIHVRSYCIINSVTRILENASSKNNTRLMLVCLISEVKVCAAHMQPWKNSNSTHTDAHTQYLKELSCEHSDMRCVCMHLT